MENKLKELAEPFDPFDIEWRVQSAGKSANTDKLYAKVIPYVDNRAIQDRLDEVMGVENWYNKFEYPTDRAVICSLTLKIGDEWITKQDGAEETNIEAVKGGLSGAMKRAAVHWGIGRYLYKLESAFVTPQQDKPSSTEIDDFILTQIKLDGRKEYVYYKRPSLPKWALPKANDDRN